MAKRLFSGGKKLFAAAVAEKLAELKSEKVPDFSRIVIVLPGKVARQNIRKELLKRFPDGLFLPRMTTPHGLLHYGNENQCGAVTADADTLLWGIAVDRALAEAEHFSELFRAGAYPNDPFRAGKCFARLRSELAAGNLSIAEAADKLGPRGRELARLEEFYLEGLKANGFTDQLELDRKAAKETAPFAGVEKLILAGLPDLPEIILQKAKNIDAAFPGITEVWINNPVEDADEFDPWGIPRAEVWQNKSYLHDNITVALDPADAARRAALTAAEKSGKFSPRECAVVLADPALFKDFAKEFSRLKDDSGRPLLIADPAGVPLKALRISQLLRKVSIFFSAPDDYRSADELLRERDFLRYAVGQDEELGRYTELLDDFKLRCYPDNFPAAKELADGKLKQLFARLSYWEKVFRSSGTVAVFLRKFLTEVYKDTDSKSIFRGVPFSAECDLFNALINEQEKLPANLIRSADKSALLEIFLDNCGEKRVTLPIPDGALVFEGRLEMPFLLQKKIIFCGMNEGYFPDRIKPTPFLTDSIRQALGIRSNKETLIRSVYHLFSTMAGRREEDLQLIVLRQDPENSVLKPSGILFNGSGLSSSGLIRRCRQLFQDPVAVELKKEETAAKKFVLVPQLDHRRTADGKMLLRVTDIDQYLRDPFDFFCSRVLGNEEVDYNSCEPDAKTSGTLIHAAFEELGTETFPSAEKLRSKLVAEFNELMLKKYGAELPMLLKLFSASTIQRLEYAAEKLFAEQRKGYEVLATEYVFGGEETNAVAAYGAVFRGKIDRIEYNRSTGTLRITDIKTGNVDNVVKEHCTITKDEVRFTRLQLPLYALLLRKDEYFRKNIFPEIDSCRIECAYLTVPHTVTDCDVKVWDSAELNSILPAAEQTLLKIIDEIALMPENKLFAEPKKINSPWLRPDALSALEGVEIIPPAAAAAKEEKKSSKKSSSGKRLQLTVPDHPFKTAPEAGKKAGCTRCCSCPEKEQKNCRCFHGDCTSCKNFNGFKSFNLITASAGTGKTYSLASRFIQLMEYGVSPESIMAVTFTKKAAGEIFDRIITRICDMAEHPEKAENCCSRFPAEKLPELIRRMTASNSGELQISTIDSFFMRLMQSFAPDFGIWGEISLLDEDDDRYRRKILHRWLAEIRSDDEQDALRELIKEADPAGRGGIYESLIKLINSISSCWKQSVGSTPPGVLPPQIKNFPYRINSGDVMEAAECGKCIGYLRGFAAECSDLSILPGKRGYVTLAKRLEKLAEALEKNFTGAFFHRLDKDVVSLIDMLNSKNPDGFWCDDEDDAPLEYSVELPEGLAPYLRRSVRHIRALSAHQAWKKTIAAAELISKFETIYSAAVRASGKLTFSDLPAVITSADAETGKMLLGPGDHSLEMRLDARFDHYMLDEFQDTSNVQMMALEPLFSEIFSTGSEGEKFRSFFCVGDMKQSIYQWRGGNPELFNFVAAKLKPAADNAGYSALDSLSLSYRSSQTVLDTVNAVFSPPYNGAVKGAEVIGQMDYRTHRSARDIAGHAAVFEVPQTEDDPDNIDAKMKIILKILDEVKPFERGLSVGILVQENKFGRKCAEKLREHTSLPISVDGKISACNTMVFNVYKSLLTLALHPGDKSSALFLSMAAFGENIADEYLMEKLFRQSGLSLAEAAAEELFRNQLAVFTANFCNVFRDECGKIDKTALDIIENAADKFSGTPQEFLTQLDNYNANCHSNANTIQIMTFHKSKGLEFDMVFLPQTNNLRGSHKKFTPESKSVHYSKDDYGAELLRPEWTAYTPVDVISKLIPPFAENIEEQKRIRNFEKCCNLYVAMTRAKRALYMLLSCSESSSTLAPDKLLQERLTPYGVDGRDIDWQEHFNDLPGETAQTRLTFSRGSRLWYKDLHIETGEKPEAVKLPEAQLPYTEKVSRASDGKEELFALPPECRFSQYSAKNTGTEVHDLLSRIEFIDENFDEKEFSAGASAEAQKIFSDALAEGSPLRDALKKSGEDIEVWNEKSFIIRDDEGNIIPGTFDRVEIRRENGIAVSAVVIDYKSDSFHSAKDCLIYAEQLFEYRKALTRLLGIAGEKISCRIYALKLKKAVDIL